MYKRSVWSKSHGNMLGWGDHKGDSKHTREWLLNRFPPSQKDLMMKFIQELKDKKQLHGHAGLDEMMTPYSLSLIMARRLEQILSAMNIVNKKKPASSFTFMDPMGGSGADALAIIETFHKHTVVTPAEIDPTKAKHMERLLDSYNKGTLLENHPHGNAKDKHERALCIVQSMSIEHLKDTMSNLDVLYLDPPWPVKLEDEYMIGKTSMTNFIKEIFKKNARLQVIICKVSSQYAEKVGEGKSTKKQLMDMCMDQRMRLEEFFPAGKEETIRPKKGKPIPGKLLEPVTVLKPGAGAITVPAWDQKWLHEFMHLDNTETELPGYGGTIRFLFISKKKDLEAIEDDPPPAMEDDPYPAMASLDVSMFM